MMQKTKLGVSTGLLGAAVYFAALFGGYIPAILITGYILLAEDSQWLKSASIKAVMLLMSIGVLLEVIGLIPSLLSWVSSLAEVFDVTFQYGLLSLVINIITKAIEIMRTVLFLLLGAGALNEITVPIPVVDRMIIKYLV